MSRTGSQWVSSLTSDSEHREESTKSPFGVLELVSIASAGSMEISPSTAHLAAQVASRAPRRLQQVHVDAQTPGESSV